VSERYDALVAALSPELLAALEERVREIAVDVARDEIARQQQRRWASLAEAAQLFGCSYDAMRMRVERGSVEYRRQGRRLYVRVDAFSGCSYDEPQSKWPPRRANARRPGHRRQKLP
jgi:hypothetical protein